jgi:hypothetical protein
MNILFSPLSRIILTIAAVFSFCFSPLIAQATQRCGTVELLDQRMLEDSTIETSTQFEQWLQSEID